MWYPLLLSCLVVSAFGQGWKGQPMGKTGLRTQPKRFFQPLPLPKFEQTRLVQEPIVQEPVYQKPIVQEPVYQKPIVQEPIYQKPLPQEPIYQEPLPQEPIVQEPLPMKRFEQKGLPKLEQTRLSQESDWTRTEYGPISAEAAQLGLGAGADEAVGGNIDTSFQCQGRGYGYYADVKNECKIWHICEKRVDDLGNEYMNRISFFCPLGTHFDQKTLGCTISSLALPCPEAEHFYEATAQRFAPPPPAPYSPPAPLRSFQGQDFGTKGGPARASYQPQPLPKTRFELPSKTRFELPSKTRFEAPSKTRVELPTKTYSAPLPAPPPSKTRFELPSKTYSAPLPAPFPSKTRFAQPPVKGLPPKTRFEPYPVKGQVRYQPQVKEQLTPFGGQQIVGLSRAIQPLQCCPKWAKCPQSAQICASANIGASGDIDAGF
jgi:hypothetical protein